MIIGYSAISESAISEVSIEVAEATLTLNLPLLSLDMQAISPSASLAFELPQVQIAIYTGASLAFELPQLNVAMVATNTAVAALAMSLPSIEVSMSATTGSVGTLAATLPQLQVDIRTGSTLAIALPMPVVAMTATSGQGARLDFTLPQLSIAMTGGPIAGATLALELPQLAMRHADLAITLPQLQFELSTIDQQHNLLAYVMNIRNTETTIYTNYDFKFIVRIGHEYYGVKEDGLYHLTGTTDDGDDIVAKFRINQTDFDSSFKKRLTHLYLDSDNETAITTYAEGVSVGTYYAEHGGRRVKHGRGALGRFWAAEVANVNGNAMRVGSLEILAETSSRKI